MVKLFLLVVAMLSYNANSQESIKASYAVDVVWVKEMGTTIAATEVPSLPSHPKNEVRKTTPNLDPQTPESVGHIDQHDYGWRWGPDVMEIHDKPPKRDTINRQMYVSLEFQISGPLTIIINKSLVYCIPVNTRSFFIETKTNFLTIQTV